MSPNATRVPASNQDPAPPRARYDAIAKIIAEVAQAAGLTVPMITGDRRSRPIVLARHLAYWRAARETGASLTAIGRAFGDRDHTTIMHGIRMHEERIYEERIRAPKSLYAPMRPLIPVKR
jgi:chromosomal replication initiation ATPase DnaA